MSGALRRGPGGRAGRLALLIGVAGACGDASDAGAGFTVRDSAGIAVAENPAPDPGAPRPWTLDPEPRVTIGELEAEGPHQLYGVVGARRLADGGIVVANGGTHELRFYEPDGSFRRAFGGEGEGPGEFLTMTALVEMAGDSLGVWDARGRRATVVSASGELGRTFALERSEGAGFPGIQEGLPDGSLLASAGALLSGDVPSGRQRWTVTWLRYGPEGALLDSLLSLPGPETIVDSGADFIRIVRAPFARRPHAAAGPEGVWAGVTDRYELRLHDPGGALRRILRVRRSPRPVDAALRAAYQEERLAVAGTPDEEVRIRQDFGALEYPDSVPTFDGLAVDAGGRVWVKEPRLPGEAGGSDVWVVFEPEGRLVGPVELPRGFTVHEIGEDWVLGELTDELDVEQVRLYGLRRGGRDPAEPGGFRSDEGGCP